MIADSEMAEMEPRQMGAGNNGAALVSAIIRRIKVVEDLADEVQLIMRIAHTDRPYVLSFVNQHVVNLAWQSSAFATSLHSSDILLRDGIGLEVCLACLNKSAGRNMNGTDFIPRLAVAFAGRRVALFGTAAPWTGRAATALGALGCEIVAVMDGFQPMETYVAEVDRTRPALVVLAMGNPKQEQVAAMIAASTHAPMTIVNGGAIADFLAQRFKRAPRWLRQLRGEWLFRLMLEPGRLWRRYILGGFAFARYVWLLRINP